MTAGPGYSMGAKHVLHGCLVQDQGQTTPSWITDTNLLGPLIIDMLPIVSWVPRYYCLASKEYNTFFLHCRSSSSVLFGEVCLLNSSFFERFLCYHKIRCPTYEDVHTLAFKTMVMTVLFMLTATMTHRFSLPRLRITFDIYLIAIFMVLAIFQAFQRNSAVGGRRRI